MDVVIFHHFLESRDINATLVSCWFSSLNNLISNWFTWKMSILPKVAPSPFSGDCPTRHWEFPPERPQGTHSPSEPTQGAGIKPRTLLPGHNAAKTERSRKITPYGNMQKFYYDEQHSVIHCAAGLSSQRRYPPLTANVHGMWKFPQRPHQIMVFSLRLTLEFSTRRATSAIMVYWECLGDFLGCEIKCSALTTNMEKKPSQRAGGPVGCWKQ